MKNNSKNKKVVTFTKEEIQFLSNQVDEMGDPNKLFILPKTALKKHQTISKSSSDGISESIEQFKQIAKTVSPVPIFVSLALSTLFAITCIVLGFLDLIISPFFQYSLFLFFVTFLFFIFALFNFKKGKDILESLKFKPKNKPLFIYLVFSTILVVALMIIRITLVSDAPSWIGEHSKYDYLIMYSVIGIVEITILVGTFETYKERKQMVFSEAQRKEEKVSPRYFTTLYIIQIVMSMIIFALAIPLLFGMNFMAPLYHDELKGFKTQIIIVMLLITSIIIFNATVDSKVNHYTMSSQRSLITVSSQLLVPILMLIIFIPKMESAIIQASVVVPTAAFNNQNFISIVFDAIVYSKEAQISMVLAIIGSATILIGKTRTGSSYLMGVGALSTAFIPVIVSGLIFANVIPAPSFLVDIFSSFAQMVYAISYISIMGIFLSIVSVAYGFIPDESGF